MQSDPYKLRPLLTLSRVQSICLCIALLGMPAPTVFAQQGGPIGIASDYFQYDTRTQPEWRSSIEPTSMDPNFPRIARRQEFPTIPDSTIVGSVTPEPPTFRTLAQENWQSASGHRLSFATPAGLSVPDSSKTALPLSVSKTKTPKIVQWQNGNVVHKQLVFEEPLLERHGLTRRPRIQPVRSGAHFYLKSVLLPFDLIKECHRPFEDGAGWGLPGSPAN